MVQATTVLTLTESGRQPNKRLYSPVYHVNCNDKQKILNFDVDFFRLLRLLRQILWHRTLQRCFDRI